MVELIFEPRLTSEINFIYYKVNNNNINNKTSWEVTKLQNNNRTFITWVFTRAALRTLTSL